MESDRANPRYTAHVGRLYPELDSLFTAGEQVESLLAHPGFHHLLAVVGAERERVDRALDSAEIPLEQAAYALKHGRRGGLSAMFEAAVAIVDTATKRRAEQAAKHEQGDAESSSER